MAKIKVAKSKGKSINDTIKEIRAKFGDESIMKLSETPHVDVDVIPTGSIGLDNALGIGGLPRGRVVEIYGPESSGKTTLALHVIANAQKDGGTCAFIDAEHAMDPEYAKKLGVNVDELFIAQPGSGEEGMQIVDSLVGSGKFDVVVVDSVAALTPLAEIEGQIGEVKVGAQARLMSQSLRVLTGPISKSNTLVIFLNQVRVNIGGMTGFGAPPETTAGGKALKFYASVRIDIRRIAQIKKGDDVVGSRTRTKVVKNKVAQPFRIAEFDIIYNEGISKEGELLSLGEKLGVLRNSGGSYSFGDKKYPRGYSNACLHLRTNAEDFEELKSEVMSKINDHGKATSEGEEDQGGEE